MKNLTPQIILSLIVTTCFFGCIFWMLKFGFPPENKDALNSLLGVLTTIFTLQQNFFFGSSSSGKDKDATLAEIAKSTPAPSGAISIPNAEAVSVKTESGDVSIANLPKDANITSKMEDL